MNSLEKAYQSNLAFWDLENAKDDTNGVLIYECFYDVPQLCYGISKVALCIAKSLGLKPIVMLPWRKSLITESMCNTRLQMKDHMMELIFANFLFMTKVFFISRKGLLNLKDGNAKIGTYIYDAILRRFTKKTISCLSFKERLFICLEVCYYLYFKSVFKRYSVKTVVLGDNVYRYGLMFELCKVNGVVCYAPISLNALFIRRFKIEDDYEKTFLNENILNQLCNGIDYKTIIGNYYKKRYEGSILQHDVLTAYANKETSNYEDFCNRYKIDKSKKTVVLMPHVFADAPHVYLEPLYDDYWEWFVNTFRCLLQNHAVNVLVKEHPSSHLFGQKGYVTSYLKEIGYNNLQILETESTLSIIRNADVVVTCGGTIGLEMTYAGKNVVLASRPPYSELGFTNVFDSKEKYEDFLSNHIQELEPLNKEQHMKAMKASYVSFCCENSWSPDMELGGDVILLNGKYDNEKLWTNIQKYNQTPLKDQHIYNLLDSFVKSDKVALFNSHYEEN